MFGKALLVGACKRYPTNRKPSAWKSTSRFFEAPCETMGPALVLCESCCDMLLTMLDMSFLVAQVPWQGLVFGTSAAEEEKGMLSGLALPLHVCLCRCGL